MWKGTMRLQMNRSGISPHDITQCTHTNHLQNGSLYLSLANERTINQDLSCLSASHERTQKSLWSTWRFKCDACFESPDSLKSHPVTPAQLARVAPAGTAWSCLGPCLHDMAKEIKLPKCNHCHIYCDCDLNCNCSKHPSSLEQEQLYL